MIALATYADENMSISAKKLIESAIGFIDKAFSYSPELLGDDFKLYNSDVLNQNRGAGYWIWKPYVLYNSMLAMKENDIVIYCDAGLLLQEDINILISKMDQDIFLFANKYRHGDWIKKDCAVAMNADSPEYLNHEQCQASVVICKNTAFARKFVKEWMLWAQFPNIIDDSSSILPEYPNMQEHRHDQSILTNLAIKYKIKLHWWPVQYMVRHKNKYNDNYPVMFQHHRKRNDEW